MTRTITAIYDSETDARHAREELLGRGLEDDDVRIVSQNLSRTDAGSDSSEHKGVWESIKDFFVGDDDRPVYSEGLRRGGYLLTARVDDDLSDEAIAALERTNAIDLDERSEQWRSEGWAGPTSTTGVGYGMGAEAAGLSSGVGMTSGASTASTEMSSAATGTTAGLQGSDEQSIPIVEERLRVGKREVDRGTVRVRSYVVEEPVHESVGLREEHVEVERRAATGRSAEGIGDAAFREQTIEVNERAEEAVVAKDAVVTEEVVVRKTSDERTETIDDTVRHTEVDIDDTTTGRTGTRSRNPAGTSGTRGNSRKR